MIEDADGEEDDRAGEDVLAVEPDVDASVADVVDDDMATREKEQELSTSSQGENR